MKTIWTILRAPAVFAGLLCGIALFAGMAPAADVNNPETFSGSGTEGWVSFDLVNERVGSNLDLDAGALRLRYDASAIGLPEFHMIKAGNGASDGDFSGDYIADGVLGISLRINCSHAVAIRLYLHSNVTGRRWAYYVPPLPAGSWQTVFVPCAPEALQALGGAPEFPEFEDDLESVAWIGIAVTRNPDKAAQSYRIDDVELVGAGDGFGAWMAQFAAGNGTLAGQDLDNDGVNNYGEWVAGTVPDDGADLFEVDEAEAAGPGTYRLHWDSVAGRIYSVLRAPNADGPFSEIAQTNATPPVNTYDDATATGSGPYFYRLKVSN